jgi:hypothetical protein
MMNQDETPAAPSPPDDGLAEDFPRPSLLEVLNRAGTAGEALKALAAACPGTPHAEILAALEEHAAALRRGRAALRGARGTGPAPGRGRRASLLRPARPGPTAGDREVTRGDRARCAQPRGNASSPLGGDRHPP